VGGYGGFYVLTGLLGQPIVWPCQLLSQLLVRASTSKPSLCHVVGV
jgi:hypothetical protein